MTRDNFEKRELLRKLRQHPFRGWRLIATTSAMAGFFLLHLYRDIEIQDSWFVLMIVGGFLLKELHDRIDAAVKLLDLDPT